ncbi:MAG: multicopper oxidase domain-containing protein, partial [Gammaproteobacteria bacterium]|nr:multicopper oxidase domain-containing protein [Gammaproteobacteria bacterium]
AHHHGSTYLQISSGAFGMMIIDDKFDGQIINGQYADLPAHVRAMEERLLTLVDLDPSVSGTGGDTIVSGTLSPGWNVNGTVNGNICMPTNTWQRWRMLTATASLTSADITIGSQCEVALMARDGVWRTMVPKNLPTNAITITGGSRADIAVRCSGDSTLSIGNRVVANIIADPALPQQAAADANPYGNDGVSQWASFRPSYLRDLRDEPVTNFENVGMGARTINGSKFDINVPTFITQADGVQEWNVKGATNHPFHLHVYHFQAQTDCGDYEAGEYYDTMAAACTVRFDLNPQTSTVYDGKTIFHCHLLDHEDQGAMGYMMVQPAPGTIPAPTFPAGAGFSEKYELDAGGQEPPPPPPPPGEATAVTVGSITVSTTNVSKGLKSGVADIVVVDNLGNPVAGAVVSGAFSGDINETISASPATNANGQTSVSTTQIEKVRALSFCVTGITDTNGVLDPFSGSICGNL